MSKKKPTLLGLIKYILSFFFASREKNKEKEQERLQEAVDDVNEEFDKIDEKTESEKNKDTKERLDNLF